MMTSLLQNGFSLKEKNTQEQVDFFLGAVLSYD